MKRIDKIASMITFPNVLTEYDKKYGADSHIAKIRMQAEQNFNPETVEKMNEDISKYNLLDK